MRWPTDGRDTGALQAYLGHRNIQHTVRYTELSPPRFKNFWPERAVRGMLSAIYLATGQLELLCTTASIGPA